MDLEADGRVSWCERKNASKRKARAFQFAEKISKNRRQKLRRGQIRRGGEKKKKITKGRWSSSEHQTRQPSKKKNGGKALFRTITPVGVARKKISRRIDSQAADDARKTASSKGQNPEKRDSPSLNARG